MAQQGEQNTPSDFDARADNAALALRQTLQRQGRQVADQAPVAVDANGRPPAPLPPQGSYARQAIELQRRQQAAQAQPPVQQQRAEDQPEVVQSMQPQTTQAAPAEHSPRAEHRIQELVAQLREKERALQEAVEMGRRATETATQFQQRLTALEQQHQQMLQQNLDQLDPETRSAVMMDARLQQRLDEAEQRILGRIQPKLQHLESTAAQQEMAALARKYPGFDYQTHARLIDQFRARNPHCSIEQAFRAVAEPEELVLPPTARAQAVPPIVPPGNGHSGAARYVPQEAVRPQARPEDELAEESRRIAELRRSTDPAKQKEGMQLLDQHLRRRLER